MTFETYAKGITYFSTGRLGSSRSKKTTIFVIRLILSSTCRSSCILFMVRYTSYFKFLLVYGPLIVSSTILSYAQSKYIHWQYDSCETGDK